MNNNKEKKLVTAGEEDILTKRRQNMNTKNTMTFWQRSSGIKKWLTDAPGRYTKEEGTDQMKRKLLKLFLFVFFRAHMYQKQTACHVYLLNDDDTEKSIMCEVQIGPSNLPKCI